MYYYNNELPPQQGWICPKCGRVNAPWLPTCGCVSSQTRATFDTTSLTDRKTEPQYDAEEAAKDINRRVDLIKREWEVRHKDEPQPNADQHVQHIGSVETMSCQECLWCADGQETCANPSLCVYKPKDEPQTDCAWK